MVSYNNLFHQAATLYDNGNYTAAEDILRSLNEVTPDNPLVLNLLGLIAQAQGLHSQACPYFRAALRINSNVPEYYYNLAFSLKNCGQYQDALRYYQKVLSLRPELKETYNEIACIYYQLEQPAEAVKYWQQALSLFPDYAIAAINLASCNNDLSALLNLSRQYPQEPSVWYHLAHLCYLQGNLNDARDYIQKALALEANSANYYLAGLIFATSDKISQAVNYFSQTEQLDENNFNAKLYLADYYSRSAQFDQAEKRYKHLIELDKHNFDVHNNYAEMLYRQNRLSEALEEYRAAILINPQSAVSNNNLGTILKDLGEYDEALGLFFNALHYAPQMPEISLNIVETLVLLARNDKEKAVKIAANWLKSYPDNLYAEQINHTLKGEKIANNNHYTESLFDAFADNYELVMQNLGYSAPLAMAKLAGPLFGRIADLGCGSGLAGQTFKSVQNQIIGVDISAKMLALAAKKNIYDELVKSDIIDFLKNRRDYDWITAADVLCYLGDLNEVISLCRGKKLLFTIEADTDISDYRLDITSRYKHNPAYVEKLLHDNGFTTIKSQNLTLRHEASLPVAAVIFMAK